MPFRVAVLLTLLCCAGAGAAVAQPAAPPAAAGWTWHPSLFVLASGDENDDPPVGAIPVHFEESEFAGNVGGGVDGAVAWGRSRVALDLFGLARSPLSEETRSMYGGGRVHWSWQPSPAWSLHARDAAAFQRQPQLPLAGFQRNDAVVGVDWRGAGRPVGFGLEVGDRRRQLPELEALGFARQSLTASATMATRTFAGEVGISAQPYQTSTAEGRRLVLSAEAARFGRGTVASLRYALAEPWVDRPRAYDDEEGSESGEFSNIDRAEFLEYLSLDGSQSTIAAETLALDPVETDSDDWDFGRRKHVLLGYLSRTVGRATQLSGSVRYQHRDGPNLLAFGDAVQGARFRDSRLGVRLTFRHPITGRFTAVAQVAALRNRSERAAADFSRRLVGVGLQIRLGGR